MAASLYIFHCATLPPKIPASARPNASSKTHRSQIRFNIFSLLTFSLQLCCHFSSPLVCECVCVCVCMGIYVLYAHEWVGVCVLVSFLRFWSSQLHVVESRAKFSIFFFHAKLCRPLFVCVCVFVWVFHGKRILRLL